MLRFLVLAFLLQSISFAVPHHPKLQGQELHSRENSYIGKGGIQPVPGKVKPNASRFSAAGKTNRIIVLRVAFSDVALSVGSGDTAYNTFVKPQVERFYSEQSRGKHPVVIDFASVGSGKTLTHTHATYAADSNQVQAMIHFALSTYEPIVDYSTYDSVIVMHAGSGAEVDNGNRIHSHRGGLQTPYISPDGVIIYTYITLPEYYNTSSPDINQTVGVIVHEYGHELGLPDLYDTVNNGGIGDWGVMSGGSYGGPNSDGTQPGSFCAWSRIFLGWDEPELATSGSHTLDHFLNGGKILKIYAEGAHKPEEYFLLENRYNGELGGGKLNWDKYMPLNNSGSNSTGISIMHVDEAVAFSFANQGDTSNRWFTNSIQRVTNHKYLDVEEASSTQSLDTLNNPSEVSDTWNSSSGVQFNNSSPSLSLPYSSTSNGLSVQFNSANGASMNVTVTQDMELVNVSSSSSGVFQLEFTADIMSNPGSSNIAVNPGLGALSVSRPSSKVLSVSYTGTLDRSQEYTITFSNFQSATGAAYSETLSNAFGTNVVLHRLEGIETWKMEKSPYVIANGDLVVDSTAQLILESGTIVLMDPGSYVGGDSSSSKLDLLVYGQLLAMGTESKPVKILPRSGSGRQLWGDITLYASKDKPSMFRYTEIRGGDKCLHIRDGVHHLFLKSLIADCDNAMNLNDTLFSFNTISIPGGGIAAQLYSNVFEDNGYSLWMFADNPEFRAINTTFNTWGKSTNFFAVVAQNPNPGLGNTMTGKALTNFRFSEFGGRPEGTCTDGDTSGCYWEFVDFANANLSIGDFNEFHSTLRANDQVTFQSTGGVSTVDSSVSQKISTDWVASGLSFLPTTSSNTLNRINQGDGFKVQVTATSATNNNAATTKRLLAAELWTEYGQQRLMVPLEETGLDTKIFQSANLSTISTGFTQKSTVVVKTTDVIYIQSIDSALLRTSLKVGLSISSGGSSNATPVLSNGAASGTSSTIQITYTLSDPDSSALTVAFSYSTDGGTNFTTSTNTTGSTTGLSPGNLNLAWNSNLDFQTDQNNVVLKLVATDGVNQSQPLTIGNLSINNYVNQAPTLASFGSNGFKGNIPLDLSVGDDLNQNLSLILEYSIDNQQSFTTSTNFSLANTSVSTGISTGLTWTSYDDIKATTTTYLRLKACDSSLCSNYRTTGPIFLENAVSTHQMQVNFSTNVAEFRFRLLVPDGAVVSKLHSSYSTDGTNFVTSESIGELSTAPEWSTTYEWYPYRELPLLGYQGNLTLKVTPIIEGDGDTYGEPRTFAYQASALIGTMSYDLPSGWSLSSFYPQTGISHENFFSSIATSMTSCAFTYSGGSFRHYCPSSLGSQAFTSSVTLTGQLTWGSSFWINLSEQSTLQVSSSILYDRPIELEAGWNLKSLVYEESTTPAHLGTDIKLLVGYEGNPAGYKFSYPGSPTQTNSRISTPLTTYTRKNGLWIYSEKAKTLAPFSNLK